MKRWLLCLVTGLCGIVAAQAAGEVTIDENWKIVIPEYTPEESGLKWGFSNVASAFADALEESVGVKPRLEIAKRRPDGKGQRLFVGGIFAEEAGLLPEEFVGYDWGIAEKDGDLYFFGRDRTGSKPTIESCCVTPSTLAVVEFMRREMGVLFVMPGKIGREVPKRARLSVSKGFFRRGTVKAPLQSAWSFDRPYCLASALYGTGALYSYSGHTYPVACPREKYGESHPEYFARNAKGENVWSQSPGCQAYCISNPEFRQLVVDELLRRYDAGAEGVELGPNDGNVNVCRCKACHDLCGTGDDWSEKLWLFHKGIAEDILKLRPGKYVQIISYHHTAQPPKTFKVFPKNVMIELCSYDEENLARWRDYTVPQGFTFYIYNWGHYPLPGFTPKRSIAGLVDQVKSFHKMGMRGILRCGYGELFGMEGPAYWVFNRLVEDPETDVPAALSTYYRGAFGPAAAAMRRFYEDLEMPLQAAEKRNSTKATDLVESTLKRSKKRDPVGLLASVYTPERVARMDAALAEAQRVKGLSEKHVRRLQLVRTEWNYVRNVGTIAFQYQQFSARPTKAACDRILDLLDERNAMIERLFPDGKTIRKVKDWPEIRLFGTPPIDHFRVNGRLGAAFTVPLLWDVEKMRKNRIVPGELMTPAERRAEMKAAGLKPFCGFKPIKTDLVKGATFESTPDGTGFRFGQGTNGHVRVMAQLGEKEGILPGRTYRLTWLSRWENVNAPRIWNGFYFSATFDQRDAGAPDKTFMVHEPVGFCHSGMSQDWTRESTLITICDRPGFVSDFIFRFWGSTDGVAEVRDFTIEEVK